MTCCTHFSHFIVNSQKRVRCPYLLNFYPGLTSVMKSFRCRFLLTAVVFSVLAAAGCSRISERIDSIRKNEPSPEAAPGPVEPENVHILFGNPSAASTSDRDNFLLIRSSAVYSYNNSRGTANWASWRTTRADLGESLPRPDFEPDFGLPAPFTRVYPFDYSRSGYDRGHLVPSADRFGDKNANRETFLMTNIVPQTGDLNQYPWEQLESFSRSLARRGHDVYTVAGVYGDKGRLRKKITIPTNCWKILIVVRAGSTLQDIDQSTRVIAVDMPNTKGIANTRWKDYLTNVRTLEQRTGYNFLSNLPPELQETLENRIGE